MENLRQILLILSIFGVIKVGIATETSQEKFFYQQGEYPKDCQDVKSGCSGSENSVSGVYLIKPEGYEEPFEVYCDHTTDGGGWTVIQRRQDNSINFARPWEYYKDGFGFLNQEFWLGNDKLAYLTNQKKYILRIDFAPDRETKWVAYDHFQITDEKGLYKLVTLGQFSRRGNFPDRMRGQVDMPFSTSDRFTSSISSCARQTEAGGWWFAGGCMKANLNGAYGIKEARGFRWQTTKLSFSEMKIKPADVS
ncbi:Fibrinogen-like protein A [Holothuria leucospilota]|uniref:Fibrinogen-like protein A n=1 Tax=Holothuria leucospilota TaxID=206669 RepID=A0A9Q1BU86_HOLLE|nr:Fibrinogen-like protein A [Holothuria leucospilota]